MNAVKELWMDEIEDDCDLYCMGEIDQYEFRERMERRLFDANEIDGFLESMAEDRASDGKIDGPFTKFARVIKGIFK